MTKQKPEVNYSIQNVGIGPRRALFDGIDETRDYLRDIGATAGLNWLPLVRSRLYAEVRLRALKGTYTNIEDGVGLIASMDQSFAPTIPEIWQRFTNKSDTMSLAGRTQRLANNLIKQRGIMPPVLKSLGTMRRMAEIAGHEALFANMYAEELPPGKRYDGPYTRSAILAPDVVESLGSSVSELPEQLRTRGITHISFDAYHATRKSQSGNTQLPPWEEYLPQFAAQGLIRQVRFSLNRIDLPEASGIEAMAQTHDFASELIKDEARFSRLGPIPEQVSSIVQNHPLEQPLDFTVAGDVSGLRIESLRNAYHNLGRLMAAA